MTEAYALQCSHIAKDYGSGEARVRALRGVDLDVRYGEIMMLVGPSGCGKTTLISVISSILDHDAGDCIVLGQDLNGLSADEKLAFRRRSIGFVFQMFNLFPTITALENVSIPLLLNGNARQQAENMSRDVLAAVGLEDKTHALPPQMSGGQQQRVAIARALVHDPRLILCDEPTSSLDHATGHRIMETLRRAAVDRKRAVLVVTHDSRIFEFADRIAYMDDGKIVKIDDNAGKERPS